MPGYPSSQVCSYTTCRSVTHEANIEQERREHTAELQIMRHRMNNLDRCLMPDPDRWIRRTRCDLVLPLGAGEQHTVR